MALISKGYLDHDFLQGYVKSKEDLIESLLIALDSEFKKIKYEKNLHTSLSRSSFDGGYLASNFIGNDELHIAQFEDELDFDLIDMDVENLRLPVFQFHCHDNHHIHHALLRAVNAKKGPIDVIANTFESFDKKRWKCKSNGFSPKIQSSIALLKDDYNWYGSESFYYLTYKDRDFVKSHYDQYLLDSSKNGRQEIKEVLSHPKASSVVDFFDRSWLKRGHGSFKSEYEKLFDNEERLTSSAREDYKFPYLFYPVNKGKYYGGRKVYEHTLSRYLQSNISAYLQEFYKWHIYIRTIDGKLGFQVPFDFEELDSIYKMREMPKTKTGRNKKIIHWVVGHKRKISIKDAQGDEIGKREIWIKRFLRGENRFKWDGVTVGIMPSKYDLKRHTGVKRKFDYSKIKQLA